MMNRGRLDAVADALRLKDAEQRGCDVEGLLPFAALNDPERARWSGLAVAALEAWASWTWTGAVPGAEDETVVSNEELEKLIGCKLSTKVEYVSRGDVAFRRVAGGWLAYPEYPA